MPTDNAGRKEERSEKKRKNNGWRRKSRKSKDGNRDSVNVYVRKISITKPESSKELISLSK